MTKENIQIKLPYFIGFYQGFEQEIDNIIENEVDYYQTELLIENASSDNFEINDFSKFKQNTVNVFANLLVDKIQGNGFDFDITNIKVDSPREYNFRGDYIFCEIPKTQLQAIKNYVDTNLKNEFAKYCMANFKSRDGFISFIGHNAYEYFRKDIDYIVAEYPDNHEFIFEGYIETFLNSFENEIQDSLTVDTCEGIRDYTYENIICDLQAEADLKLNELFG